MADKSQAAEHKLVNNTLVVERPDGIVARCQCGWVSAGHFSSLAASLAFRDHQENTNGA